MATEPERPIEKLLRAWAKKRRDDAGAPPELHPATRRLLQGEAARRFARGGLRPGSVLRRLRLLRLGLAEALVIIALVAVVGSLLLPGLGKTKSKELLAMNEKKVPAQETSTVMRELAPTPAASSAKSAKGTPQTLVASEDGSLSKANGSAGLFQAKEQEAEIDRERATGAMMVPQTAAVIAQPAVPEPATGRAGQPTPPAGPSATAPVPTERPAVTLNYGLTASRLARSAAPSAPPPAVLRPAAGPTVAGVENKQTQYALKSLGANAGQLGFGSNSLDKDVSQRGRVVAFADTKRASEGILADKSKASNDAVPPGQPALLGSFKVAPGKAKETSSIQRFAQVGPALEAGKASLNTPVPPVLISFQVEQAGRELRIVDDDGSVYSGLLEITRAPARRRAARSEGVTAATTSGASARMLESTPKIDAVRPAPPSYFFRVTGTNRSLQQKVVFTGNLITLTNPAALARIKAALGAGSGGQQAVSGQQTFVPLLNSRISGKVKIGNAKPTEINAAPAPARPPGQ